MNIKHLSLEDIVLITESLCNDYGDSITEDCMDEIVEKIFDQYDSSHFLPYFDRCQSNSPDLSRLSLDNKESPD